MPAGRRKKTMTEVMSLHSLFSRPQVDRQSPLRLLVHESMKPGRQRSSAEARQLDLPLEWVSFFSSKIPPNI